MTNPVMLVQRHENATQALWLRRSDKKATDTSVTNPNAYGIMENSCVLRAEKPNSLMNVGRKTEKAPMPMPWAPTIKAPR